MDEQLITIRLNSVECVALEILLERLRKRYQETKKEYGYTSKQYFGIVKLSVFQDQFEAVETLDNVLRMKLNFKPFE